MSLDTVKMFFQNERNKLIGIGVASCLVTTAIVAPTTYFTGQPKYDGLIKPIAFNTISATGKHLADYGGFEPLEDEYGWGNEEYLSYVTTDADLVNNVLDIENGLGFIGKNVAIHEAAGDETKLNIMSAEFTNDDGVSKYVDPTDDKDLKNYKLVAPINIYMRVPAPVSIFFKDNLMSNSTNNTIWTANIEETNELAGWDPNHKEALASYFGWANENNYLDDLLMDFTFFNWMLFTEASNGTNYGNLDGYTNPEPINTKTFEANVDNMLNNVARFNNKKDEDKKIKADDSTMDVQIAGTGTDDPFVQSKASSFNTDFLNKTAVGGKIKEITSSESIAAILTSSGSSTAWYMPNEEIKLDTNGGAPEGEWSLDGGGLNSKLPGGDAFIGTQSRRSYYGSYTSSTTGDKSISGMSQWGYGYQSTAATGDNEWNYMEQPHASDIGVTIDDDSFGEQKDSDDKPIVDDPYANEIPWDYTNEMMDTSIALPLGFTATTDPLVFFTASDTTFEHKANDSNPKGTYKPTGMTPEATKLVFKNPSQEPNITWEFLFSNEFIDAELV